MAAAAATATSDNDGGGRRSLPPRHEAWSSGDEQQQAKNDGKSESGTFRAAAGAAGAAASGSDGSHDYDETDDSDANLDQVASLLELDGPDPGDAGEGLEVVISSYSDDVDAVEFKLPDDGSSAPLDAGMSRAASSHSLASSTRSGGSSLGPPSASNASANAAANASASASSGSRGGGGGGLGKPPMPASATSRRSHSTSEIPPLGSSGGSGRRRSRSASGGPGSGRLSRQSSSPASTTNNRGSGSAKKPILRRAVSDTAATTAQQRKKRPGVVAMAKMGYQECVNAIIRPPRAKSYKDATLGPPVFNFGGQTFARQDFDLTNDRDLILKCSHWTNTAPPTERVPCVIYMHGNSSARLEVLPQLSYLLSLGVSVLSFDFGGSGKSGGDYVSLGYYERDDLATVIDHLRSAGTTTSTIALWGRSMGAATCLMHAPRDPSIACMVVDSAFADLTQLATEMVERGKEHGVNVPGFVTSMALRMIRGSVKKQANFDIRQCRPIQNADQCFVPALFVHGRDDVFIKRHHSQDIHERYAGDKNIIVVEGDHNTPRPRFMFDSASIFLQTCLQIPPDWTLERNPKMNRMAPPWLYPGALDGLRDQDEHGLAAPFSRSLSSSSCGDGLPTLSPVPSGSATKDETEAGSANGDGSDGMGDGGSNDAAAKLKRLIDDDDELDALLTELDNDTGMTIERQDEIQSSLMKMLGGNADDSAEGSDNGTVEEEKEKEEEQEQEQATAPEATSEESSSSANCLAEDIMTMGLACCQSAEDARKEEEGEG